ncbi:hypothetical protein IFM89_001063 [Coptis chinensis]|uniref:Uncharacterized protein n=1 Tax=Coptis chinensis TaxID=261450 RepID=A0A835H954_9MAGN|nr:hypothetical protein IFM89_001063 [Coptis chinensis]
MVRRGKVPFEGTPERDPDGDGVGPVARRIRARGYEPRCRGFESFLAYKPPKRLGLNSRASTSISSIAKMRYSSLLCLLVPWGYGTKDYPSSTPRQVAMNLNEEEAIKESPAKVGLEESSKHEEGEVMVAMVAKVNSKPNTSQNMESLKSEVGVGKEPNLAQEGEEKKGTWVSMLHRKAVGQESLSYVPPTIVDGRPVIHFWALLELHHYNLSAQFQPEILEMVNSSAKEVIIP